MTSVFIVVSHAQLSDIGLDLASQLFLIWQNILLSTFHIFYLRQDLLVTNISFCFKWKIGTRGISSIHLSSRSTKIPTRSLLITKVHLRKFTTPHLTILPLQAQKHLKAKYSRRDQSSCPKKSQGSFWNRDFLILWPFSTYKKKSISGIHVSILKRFLL